MLMLSHRLFDGDVKVDELKRQAAVSAGLEAIEKAGNSTEKVDEKASSV